MKKFAKWGCLGVVVLIVLLVFVSIGGDNLGGDDNPPEWCEDAQAVWAELALQDQLQAQHGDYTEDWPEADLARLGASIESQTEAAARLWESAPESHTWSDVEQECRGV